MDARENRPEWWTWQGKAEREFARIRRLYRPWWTWNGGTERLLWFALAAADRAPWRHDA